MLRFLYCCQYPCRKFGAEGIQYLSLRHHLDVCVLADKYDLPELEKLATKCFKDAAYVSDAGRFEDIARAIYRETPEGSTIRKAVAEIINERWKTMFSTTSSRRWIADVPELGTDLLFLQPGCRD